MQAEKSTRRLVLTESRLAAVLQHPHAVSRQLRDNADDYLALDPHFDELSLITKTDRVLCRAS